MSSEGGMGGVTFPERAPVNVPSYLQKTAPYACSHNTRGSLCLLTVKQQKSQGRLGDLVKKHPPRW
jgi:hypothetical protein